MTGTAVAERTLLDVAFMFTAIKTAQPYSIKEAYLVRSHVAEIPATTASMSLRHLLWTFRPLSRRHSPDLPLNFCAPKIPRKKLRRAEFAASFCPPNICLKKWRAENLQSITNSNTRRKKIHKVVC